MNTGYLIALLGVIGIVAGGLMYSMDFHRTIGLGGIGLGVVLVLVGLYASRMKAMAKPQAMPTSS